MDNVQDALANVELVYQILLQLKKSTEISADHALMVQQI